MYDDCSANELFCIFQCQTSDMKDFICHCTNYKDETRYLKARSSRSFLGKKNLKKWFLEEDLNPKIDGTWKEEHNPLPP